MQSDDIRKLIDRLEHLRDALSEARMPGNRELAEGDPLVKEASECELMLPSILTAATLREAAERKLNTAAILLERAIRHEELSPEVQIVADEGYLANEEDLQHGQEGRHAAP
jgi:hypothetical protein